MPAIVEHVSDDVGQSWVSHDIHVRDFGGIYPGGNWGEAIGTFRGITAYSNGVDTGGFSADEPIFIDGYLYQCTEYMRRCYRVAFSHPVFDEGGPYAAEDCYALAALFGLNSYPNGGAEPPQRGDILCFDGPAPGSPGHCAIILSLASGRVNVIEQNVNAISAYGYYLWDGRTVVGPCQGWLRLP